MTVKFACVSLRQVLGIIHYFYGKNSIRLHFTADGSNLRNGNPRTTIAVVVEPTTQELLKMQSKQVSYVLIFFFNLFCFCLYLHRREKRMQIVSAVVRSFILNVSRLSTHRFWFFQS
jgi:hypothetical protein